MKWKGRSSNKGKFKPYNTSKYKGDPTGIVYRSSWELKLMIFLDKNPAILEWNSEEIIIPYISPIDNKRHRYFPDFWVKRKNKEGIIEEIIVEIKPKEQMMPPINPNKKNVAEYLRNQSKWTAAKNYCENKQWKFFVLNEENLGIRRSN